VLLLFVMLVWSAGRDDDRRRADTLIIEPLFYTHKHPRLDTTAVGEPGAGGNRSRIVGRGPGVGLLPSRAVCTHSARAQAGKSVRRRDPRSPPLRPVGSLDNLLNRASGRRELD
jgi:hypothetical protein